MTPLTHSKQKTAKIFLKKVGEKIAAYIKTVEKLLQLRKKSSEYGR